MTRSVTFYAPKPEQRDSLYFKGACFGLDEALKHYYYLHLPYHLAEATERERLDSLLLDPSWLAAKLVATATTAALIADYDHYAMGEPQQLIGRTLRLTAGICARDPHQLIPQLLGRLMTNKTLIANDFLKTARQCVQLPAILEERPGLAPPGTEVARLERHGSLVSTLCVLPDGRLASGSHDFTIRLWDVARGAEDAHLGGHWGSVTRFSDLYHIPPGAECDEDVLTPLARGEDPPGKARTRPGPYFLDFTAALPRARGDLALCGECGWYSPQRYHSLPRHMS
jgi:APAF-1 helical domain/WD domain, G-beta repeat